MPNKKKNVPKNAFYFYMVELQEEERNRGNHYNMKQIAEIAGPQYKLLPEVDKQYFENKAKENKGKLRQAEGKLDSFGNSVDEIARHEKETLQEEKNMFEAIRFKLHYLKSMEDVANEPFYFLSTNMFCCTDEGDYIPAEIGCVKYCIADGIMNKYHSFIDPGPLPLGYSFACKEMSERTHKIPPQNFELANKNYAEILDNIMAMLSPDDKAPENISPIYVLTEEIMQTKAILEWLQSHARLRRHVNFKIYDTAALMLELLTYANRNICTSIALIHDYLAVDCFTYFESTCCTWHFEQDTYEHCAMGKVNRVCYVFSDHLCILFNITPIPNRHLPERPLDECAPFPPARARRNRATPIPESPKPTISQAEINAIVKNARSHFTEAEDYLVVPSAAPECRPAVPNIPAASSTSSVASSTSVVMSSMGTKPLRAPKDWSFADVTNSQLSSSQQQFQLKDDEFPSLGGLTLNDDTRSESSISVSSCGNQSSSSVPSMSSSVGTVSSWRSSAVGSSHKQNPLPIGRGIGRGRPLIKK